MKLINNLRIGAKLSLGFGLCLALACLVGLTSIRKMAEMNSAAGRITTDALQGSHDLAAEDSSLLKARNDYFEVLGGSDAAARSKLLADAHTELEEIKKAESG